MKFLKLTTIIKQLSSLATAETTAKEQYYATLKDINDKRLILQDRCEHETVDAEWNSQWDGWDDHEDLKGYYNYVCTTCKIKLKTDVVKTEHRRIWPTFVSDYRATRK